MRENLLKASKEIQRLDYVWRYSTIPISVPENVSGHSYAVTAYSAMICQETFPDNYDILCACIMHAIVHDIAEGIGSGDIVRTFKYRTKALKNAVDEAEDQVIAESSDHIRNLFSTANRLSEKCENKSIVKAIVKAADFMSLYNFMTREIDRGNNEILPFFEIMEQDLVEMTYQTSNSQNNDIQKLSSLYHEMSISAKNILIQIERIKRIKVNA